MDKDVENFCKSCHSCQIVSPFEHPEPMHPTTLPTDAWKDLAINYLGPFPNGKNILVVIDYYSRFIEAIITTSTTASTTIEILEEIFCRFGYPDSLRADQAPQFSGTEIREYCHQNGIRLVSNTPRWPQANGEVERQNRSIMKVLKIAHSENQDMQKALNTYLLAYRSTPHTITGFTPAKLMFNREIRDKLPTLYVPVLTDYQLRDRDAEMKASSKLYADTTRRATPKSVDVGDSVLVRQMAQNKLDSQYCPVPFQITARDGNAVTVRSPSGAEYRRNTTWVKPYQAPLATPTADVQQELEVNQLSASAASVPVVIPVSARASEQTTETTAYPPLRPSQRKLRPPQRLTY